LLERPPQAAASAADYIEAARLHRARGESSGVNFILSSDVMRDAVLEAELAARFDAGSILIAGESGVGKAHLARLVHHWGPARHEPFVAVDCAAVSRISGGAPSVMRSDWFINVLQQDHGTVFLRGVHRLTQPLQLDLLRFLEGNAERRATGQGAALRLISSAPDTLYTLVREGAFHSDLYYRLNGVYLGIPPLRERPTDVEPLLQYFIWVAAMRQGLASPGLRPEWRALYDGYTWPGNVRESQEVAEAIVSQCALSDLPRDRMH
jgi:transcriptional regulator of aroF, aroG, tyrA and aromatic amino acid transport